MSTDEVLYNGYPREFSVLRSGDHLHIGCSFCHSKIKYDRSYNKSRMPVTFEHFEHLGGSPTGIVLVQCSSCGREFRGFSDPEIAIYRGDRPENEESIQGWLEEWLGLDVEITWED